MFRIFESNDADESVAALDRFFGGQHSISRLSPTANHTSNLVGSVANSLLVHFKSAHELLVEREETRDAIAVVVPLSGRFHISSGTRDEIIASEKSGIIMPMEEPLKAELHDYDGLGLMIPRSTIKAGLESLLGRSAPTVFDLELNPQISGGNLICGLVKMAANQLERIETPLAQQAVAARLEELIVNALLHGQPHSCIDTLAGERQTATPKQVRRAEEYIRAHSREVIRLSQIADAAGCSVRALQLAFRTFRDTTPMSLHRQARFECAHAELLESDSDSATVTEIAVKYGFYNIGRFAHDYRRFFGHTPSETLRLKLLRRIVK